MTQVPTAVADTTLETRGIRSGLAALLLLACLLAYLRVLGAEFIYDDGRLVQANPNVTSLGAALRAFFVPLWAFEDPTGEFQNAFWRPLTVLVLALGRTLSGLDASGYHALSLLLHGLATLAAWRLASRLLQSGQLGFAVALVFALHPVHVESVAWISAVNDPLYGLFALLSLDAYVAWRQRGSAGTPIGAGLWLLIALLCKEQALAVLPIALVIDLALGHLKSSPDEGDAQGEGSDPFAELVRAYAPMLVALGLYYAGRVVTYGDVLAGFDQVAAGFLLGGARATQFRIEMFGGFLELLAFPFDQRVFRQVRPELPEGHASWIRAIVWSVVWLAGLGWAFARKRRIAAAMLLAIPAAFSLILIRYEGAGAFPISDRYLYVPVVFAGVLAAALLRGLLPARTAAAVLGLVALVGGARTFAYAGTFRDEETFFRRAVEVSPDNVYVRWGMGRVLLEKYNRLKDKEILDEAAFHYLTSLKLGTDYGANTQRLGPEASFAQRAGELNEIITGTPREQRTPDPTIMWTPDDRLQANLGQGWCTLFLALATPERDLEWPQVIFERTIEMWPRSTHAHTGLGTVYMEMGRLQEAETSLREAVRLSGTHAEAWYNLGQCLARQKRWDEARSAFEEAQRYRPGHLDYLVGAATAAIDARRFDIAKRHLDEAARLHPGSVQPVFWRGMLTAARGNLPEALARFDEVLARMPDHPRAHMERGRLLMLQGELVPAQESLGRACELLPDNFEVHALMAELLISTPGGEPATLVYLDRAYRLCPPDASRQILHVSLAQLLGNDWEHMLALASFDGRRSDHVHALSWIELASPLLRTRTDVPKQMLASLDHQRGRHLRSLRHPEEALAAFQASLANHETLLALHDAALVLAQELGRPDDARPYAERALELLPTSTEVTDPNHRDVMRQVLQSLARGETPAPMMGPVPDEGGGR